MKVYLVVTEEKDAYETVPWRHEIYLNKEKANMRGRELAEKLTKEDGVYEHEYWLEEFNVIE